MLLTPPGELWADAFLCYFLTFCSLLPAIQEWNSSEDKLPQVVSFVYHVGLLVKRSHVSCFEKTRVLHRLRAVEWPAVENAALLAFREMDLRRFGRKVAAARVGHGAGGEGEGVRAE